MTVSPLEGKALYSFVNSNKWINIWEGSVSSGKTYTSLFAWIWFCINGPPGELVMVGRTERTLKRNVVDLMVTIFGSENVNTTGMGRGEIHIYGRRVYLVGANDERSETKIRGVSLVGAYLDEVTIYPESFFLMLLSRMRSPGARLYGTTNPDSPFHWLKVFMDRDNLDLARFHFTIDDNPNLSETYVKNLRATYTGLWYRRFILGEWVLAQGAIYDAWDESKHVVKTNVQHEYYIVCVDYGTTNPCAFLLLGVTGDNITVVKEYYYDSAKTNRQKTDAEYAQDLKQFIEGVHNLKVIVVDPSASSFKVAIRQALPHTVLKDADNSVIDGIRTVSTKLVNGNLKVHESCVNLRKEVSGYVWDPSCQVRGEDKPMKVFDHACDALRYGVYTMFNRPKTPKITKRFI